MRENLYSISGQKASGSKIRELLKYKTEDAFYFAGGLPAAEIFPKEQFKAISDTVFLEKGNITFQYGPTSGYIELKSNIKQRMQKKSIFNETDEVIITSGAQQAVELVLKLFIDKKDGVVTENPTFISSINSLKNFSENVYAVDMQQDGIDTSSLEQACQQHKIKLLYTIPTFHNPTGIVTSLEKRKRILELAEKYDFMIIEDDPYGELRFKGEHMPTLKQLDVNNRVIYISAFSKILSPGARVGWLVANKNIVAKMEFLKQTDDVHTSMFSQVFISEFLKLNDLDAFIKNSTAIYSDKCEAMLNAIKRYFPKECEIVEPQGGLFIWCSLPFGLNALSLLEQSLKQKVVFVPGNTFLVNSEEKSSSFRLNYSNASHEKIEQGMKILGEIIKSQISLMK